MKPELFLYGTLGCHLCDQAEVIVLPLAQHYGLTVTCIDIADNDALAAIYDVRIPVLSCGSQELEWPFDKAEIIQFLLRSTNIAQI